MAKRETLPAPMASKWVKVNAATWQFEHVGHTARVGRFIDGFRIYIDGKKACLNVTPLNSLVQALRQAEKAIFNL